MIKTLKNQTIPGSNGRPLVYDITYKETAALLPVILFCHGYKGFKDWGTWNLMSQTLAGAGMACVKFNYSHNGGTIEQPIDFPDLEAFGNNNYSLEIQDTNYMLDWLAQTSLPIDRSRIYLMGHSRAGGITAIVASRNSMVKGLITLAGVSDFESRFPRGAALQAWKTNGVTYVENARTKQQMPLYYQFYKDFIAHKDQLNILNAVRNLNKPHLIIHGDRDEAVSLVDAFAFHDNSSHGELRIIGGANHVFGAQHPWEKPFLPEALHKVIHCMTNFVGSH